jgi:diacylglycerol kinase (ATP)
VAQGSDETARQRIRACLITNPRSGRGGIDLTEILLVLDAQGWDVTVRAKQHGGHATELAQQAAAEGFNVVVDCGGDGTLSEIVGGVVGTDVAVGTLPGGTINLWSKEVGISKRLRVAAMQLASAERHRLDVGHISINGKHDEHFLLMAGLGVDGAIVERVDRQLKNRIGPLATGLAAMRALPSLKAVEVEAEMDGGVTWKGTVSQVIVGNTRRYAGFTEITNRAFADDGFFDICFITAAGPLSASRQLGSLLLRQRPSDASAEYYRSASLTLHSPRLLPAQLDGGRMNLEEKELDGETEYRFTLRAQAVSLLVPRTYNGDLFQPEFWSETHARATLVPVEANGHNRHDGHNGGHGKHAANGRVSAAEERQKKRMRVVSVGPDTLTAAKLKNGRVVTIAVHHETLLRDRDGEDRPLWGALASLAAGDVIAVRGKKDKDANGTIRARRVKLIAPEAQ